MRFLEDLPNRILYKPLQVETLRQVLSQVVQANSAPARPAAEL